MTGDGHIAWESLKRKIGRELDAHRQRIPAERVADIEHYLDHGEYAMAFEYLFLELIDAQCPAATLSPTEVRKMADLLNLQNETNYDQNFKANLERFLANPV